MSEPKALALPDKGSKTGIVNSSGAALRRVFRIAALVLCIFLVQIARCADQPAGKVVWWGTDLFPHNIHYPHTNGVIEIDEEVLTNIVAIFPTDSGLRAIRSDSTVLEIEFNVIGAGKHVETGLSNIVSLAEEAGFSPVLWAFKPDGTVLQIEDGRSDRNILAGVSNLTKIVRVDFGIFGVNGYAPKGYLMLKKDGTVWGARPSIGEEVDGTTPSFRILPVTFKGQMLSNIVDVFALDCGLTVIQNDGTIYSLGIWDNQGGVMRGYRSVWGGQDGKISFKENEIACAFPKLFAIDGQTLSNVTALAVGSGHTLALKSDGTVVAWRFNSLRDDIAPDELPMSTPADSEVPKGLRDVMAIAAAPGLGLALKSNRTVVAWGLNNNGQASVPAGLSNVVAIAVGGGASFAITTGNIPSSVYVHPHGQLEEMEREADVIFKGRVISSVAATNASFPTYAKPHATKFKLISVVKGNIPTNETIFWHYTAGPDHGWGGGDMPSWHQFTPGESYLIYAAKLDKPCYLYNPPPDATNRPGEFRQLYREGVTRTLDGRPVTTSEVKPAHWQELGLLLKDTHPSNQLYAIEILDGLSLAGRYDDRWEHKTDFKRRTVLEALIPLTTNDDERVACRAISCYGTETNAATLLAPFTNLLVRIANESRSSLCRLTAISALSGLHGEAVSNSLARLLKDPDVGVRVGAVCMLLRFPAAFAEHALREREADGSASVRSMVADVIGDGRFTGDLPVLARLFSGPPGLDASTPPGIREFLPAQQRFEEIYATHKGAGLALLKFDVGQVAGILRTNLDDPEFHVYFVAKLAEKDAGPWLPELARQLEARLEYVNEHSKLSRDDPRRYQDLSGDMIMFEGYANCFEAVRHYLMQQPAGALAGGEMDRYLNLLDRCVPQDSDCAGGCGVDQAKALYELYQTKGLTKRAAEIRRRFAKWAGWWFDEFDKRRQEAAGP